MSNEDNYGLPDVSVRDLDKKSVTVKFYIDKSFAAKISKKLEPYRSIPYKFRPALEQIADYVRTDMIPRTFEREGPGWAPLAPMTMALRRFLGYQPEHPILYREGDLFRELTQKSHPRHIEIIKVGKDARIEIGGSSEKFLENQMGAPRLPKRPMLPGTGDIPVEDRDRRAIRDIMVKAIRKQTNY